MKKYKRHFKEARTVRQLKPKMIQAWKRQSGQDSFEMTPKNIIVVNAYSSGDTDNDIVDSPVYAVVVDPLLDPIFVIGAQYDGEAEETAEEYANENWSGRFEAIRILELRI